ncbi:MAG: sulfurtransferase [Actinomycetia bacterium]|nr:sulfurtransferase [Actinomycetes bacterium]
MRYQLIDCRFDLADPSRGRALYFAKHLPDASFLDLEDDLSDLSRAPSAGRHPLPAAEDFARSASAAGIDQDGGVLAYDDGSLAGAARLWWLLRHFGHEHVAVLVGGMSAWLGDRACGVEDIRAGTFVPGQPKAATIDAGEIQSRLGSDDLVVLDARASERYRGEVEPIDPVAGHIPGALNVPFADVFAAGLPERAVEADEVAVYCGSGVSACVVLLALAQAGRPDARLYAGSWSEWCRLGLPVARA